MLYWNFQANFNHWAWEAEDGGSPGRLQMEILIPAAEPKVINLKFLLRLEA